MQPNMAAASAVERSEELRIALVMNGGVSLAVWIGGVTFEINRLVGETHPVYRQLLELTRTSARVDVISGASAGGVNGAAMALATVYDKSLYTLRDVWLNRGAFADLLRKPSEKDPPSLLDGNGYFLPLLRDAFKNLTRAQPRSAQAAPMHVSMPATLLRGEPHTRLDDLGETIEDATHRGQFRFARAAGADPLTDPLTDPFADPQQIAEALAQAARATASFPVAFEPVLAPAQQIYVGSGTRTTRYAHYLVDGGVLDNKPIEGALRAIVQLPAHGNVRRVLAYVVPDPSVSAIRADDTAEAKPEIAHVALSSLVAIPGAESIADQLDEIDAHNERVRHLRNLPAMLVTTLERASLEQLKYTLFPAYRQRRISGVLDYVLEEIERHASAVRADGTQSAFGRRSRNWLKALWLALPEEELNTLLGDFIPTGGRAFEFDLEQDHPQRRYTWGLFALEYLAGVMLDLLRRTQRLTHLTGPREASVAAPLAPADVPAPTTPAPIDWEALDQTLRDRRAQPSLHPGLQAPAPQERDAMAALWDRAFRLRAQLTKARGSDSERLHANAATLLQQLALAQARAGAGDAREAQEAIAREWLLKQLRLAGTSGATTRQAQLEQQAGPEQQARHEEQARLEQQARLARHAAWARELAQIVLALRQPIERLLALPDDAASLRPEERAAWNELARFRHYLYDEAAGVVPLGVNLVMHRLLAFEVVQYASAERPREVDTFVELVQVSAHQQSPLGGGATPEQKLAGMQLAHFGAFYRKAWRANDWMMGRLDGISRVVRIALNPDRLHRLYGGRHVHWGSGAAPRTLPGHVYVERMLYEIAVAQAEPALRATLDAAWHELRPAIQTELAFLASPRARVPETLPACCDLLTRRLHLEVLCREIPQLATAVLDDIDAGAATSTQGARLAGQVAYLRATTGFMAGAGRALRSMRARLQRAPEPGAAQPTLPPEEAVRLFREYQIGSERLANEIGTDLMLRTGTQTAVVAHAAASGERSGLKPAAPLLTALRWPVHLLYLLGHRLSHESRTSAGITTALLVAGFLLVFASQAWDKAPAGTAVAGWSLLFAWLITAYLRNRWAAALIGVLLAIMLYLAAGPERAIGAVAAVAIAIAIITLPAWLSTTAIALAAAWWLTGKPVPLDIAAGLCDAFNIDRCAPTGNPDTAQNFLAALLLLSLVLAAALLARLADRRRG
jgi:patatin-related protein